ncbi:lipopolysaccharide assembly protein LapA domain-containing protein [Congregibacter sp.]|nr:lipopolysaccharide assembly protein LapA domain-containing protein [Congregibacter sp.]MDA8961858.1 lipopolysaccharide assembly protein LapA domain-containing protein [Congregibacter sp.]
MGFIRKLFALILAVAMAAVGVLFALQNAEPVPLDVLIMILPPRSLALWVLGALALGGLLGLLLSSIAVLRLRARLMSARRQLANSQVEMDKLRVTGLARRE